MLQALAAVATEVDVASLRRDASSSRQCTVEALVVVVQRLRAPDVAQGRAVQEQIEVHRDTRRSDPTAASHAPFRPSERARETSGTRPARLADPPPALQGASRAPASEPISPLLCDPNPPCGPLGGPELPLGPPSRTPSTSPRRTRTPRAHPRGVPASGFDPALCTPAASRDGVRPPCNAQGRAPSRGSTPLSPRRRPAAKAATRCAASSWR